MHEQRDHRHSPTRAAGRPRHRRAAVFAALLAIPGIASGTARAGDPPAADTAEQAEATPSAVLPARLGLLDALALAVEHSPVIRSTREKIAEQQGLVIVARAETLPEFNAEGTYDAIDGNRVESFGGFFAPLDQSWRADLVVRYAVYEGGSPTARLRAAEASREAARHRLDADVNSVLLEVALRYFDGLLARDRIRVQTQALEVLEQQLNNARNRFDAGAGSQFNVLQAEVALANARPPLIRAESRLRIAVDQIRRAIGASYPTDQGPDGITLVTDWPTPPPRSNLADSLAQAMASRPELAALQQEIRAGESRVRAAQGSRLPKLDLVAGYGAESERFSDDVTRSINGWTAGFRVSVPIFDLGRIRGRVEQESSRLRQTMIAAEKERLDIEGEVREAWLNFQEASEILETSQLVVKQAEEALRLARASFDAGTVTQLDVLQSQFQLTESRLEEAVALHTYHTALASLRRAIGVPVDPRAPLSTVAPLADGEAAPRP